MGKRFVSGALVAALAVGMVSISAVSAHATASQESEFVSLINHERTSRGLHSLVTRSDLISVAREHSAEMAKAGTIWHDGMAGDPTPNSPATWDQVSGWKAYGENVGMGPMSGVGDPVKNLHTAFMNSPDHKKNILYPTFNQVGVGVVVSNDTMYVTEIFVQRGSTTTTTTTTTHTTTTTTHHTTSTTHSSTAPARAAVRAVAPKPKPKPAVAAPQTVDLLVRMVGMDADQVDPATGAAAGF